MKRLVTVILFFVILTAVSFSQGIQDSVFHIQQVRVTAKQLFKKEEAGMKETKVDSIVLMEKINLSISDILRENTSVFIKDYGRGALATASFRGTAPSHTQVSWNGININSPMLGMVDFSLIPVYIVDEMSLQHGSASVSEHSGGLGGHISIDNNVNWNNKISGRYYQIIGSYSTFDEFGQFNIGNKKIQSKTRVYHNYSKNDYKFLNKHIPVTDSIGGEVYHVNQRNKNADYKKRGIQQELYFRPTQNFYTSTMIWYQDAVRSIPTVLSYEGNDSTVNKENTQTDKTFKAVLHANYYKNKLKAKINTGIDYQQLDYVLSIKNSGLETLKPVNSASDMLSWYNKIKLEYELNDKISTKFITDANHFNINTLDSTTNQGYNEERMEYSIFAGIYFVALHKKINVSTELRKDFIPVITSPFIFSLGLSYKPFSNNDLIAKLAFSRNFHAPTLNDLYWQPGGNPELLPEKGHTLEGGLHYAIQNESINIESQLTGYHSYINNWIQWLPSVKGPWEASNLKKVATYGLEYNVNVSWHFWQTGININGNYAYTKSINKTRIGDIDESVGSQLPFIPVHSANVLLSANRDGYHVNYQYYFYGKRNLLSSNYEGPDGDFPFYRLYPQHLSNISAGKKFPFNDKNLGIELKIQNIFNEVYRNALNRFMPRRNYSVIIKFDF